MVYNTIHFILKTTLEMVSKIPKFCGTFFSGLFLYEFLTSREIRKKNQQQQHRNTYVYFDTTRSGKQRATGGNGNFEFLWSISSTD